MSKAVHIEKDDSRDAGLRLPAPYEPTALKVLAGRFGSPLFLIDCDLVRRQYRALAAALPGVDLHYALKPLPQASVVKALAREGAWFDLATNGEVDLVRDAGVDAARCIHTHPIKREGDVRHALEYGVTTFVADNPDEIDRLAPWRGRIRLLLRVAFRSPEAIVDLSRKFGCEATAVLPLAERAVRAGLDVAGLSFHVGSQVGSPEMYLRAIETCAGLIAEAPGRELPPFEVLDVGGGFPIDYLKPALPIEKFCSPIRAALTKLPKGLRIIAEPGRFLCGPAGSSVATVMGRAQRDGRWWYYLDDGLYGAYSGQLYDHSRFPIEPVDPRPGPRLPCVLAGPTCDSIDVVAEDMPMPKLEIGDLLIGRQMGAYTIATSTDFNFFPRARVVPVNVEPVAA